jgi:probable F420-dependent oxidoreductase
VQIGVTVPNIHEHLAEPEALCAIASAAERLGFASVWANDHVVIPGAQGGSREPAYAARYGEQRGQRLLEPLVTLAFLAGGTDRILLGTSVYLLALRHPLLAAKQVVSLDVLSGGRVIFGVGVGWLEDEYAAVGVPFRRRGARTDEALATFAALCESDDAGFLPKPLQRPRPPVWIGGRSEAAMRRAARVGDAWHPSHLTVEELRRWVPELRRECERAGRAPGSVAVTTRRRLVRSGPVDEAEEGRVLEGDAGRIAGVLDELEEAGVSHIVVEVPGSTHEEVRGMLEWLGREVTPHAG